MIRLDFIHEDGRTDTDCFYPGELLTVIVQWKLPEPECILDLELCWETEGKGTDNQEVAHEFEWHTEQAVGEKEIAWRLPRGPLSCEGTLLKIRWNVVCVIESLGIEARRTLTLSTTGEPVKLPVGKLPAAAEKIMRFFSQQPPPQSTPAT